MKFIEKLLLKFGYIPITVSNNLAIDNTKLIAVIKEQEKTIAKLQKQQEQLNNTNRNLLKEVTELKLQVKACSKNAKDLQRKNRALLQKQGKWKTQIAQLEAKVKLMAKYQIVNEQLIDYYKYGFNFSYLESLKPRQIIEINTKSLKYYDKLR